MKNNAHSSWQRLLPDLMGAAALLASWALGDGGLFLLLGIGAWIAGSEYAWRFLSGPGPTPYRFMLFSPLLLVHYASIGDFRIRLACFFMLIYIIALALRAPRRQPERSMPVIRPWQAWALALLTSMLAAFLLHVQGIQLSGDEPHYVMISQSLVEDGDFDLKNNLEQKTYFSYLPVELRFHGAIHSGRYRSFHLPGLSFLLAPFFFLFKLLGGLIPGQPLFPPGGGADQLAFLARSFFVPAPGMAGKGQQRFLLLFHMHVPAVFPCRAPVPRIACRRLDTVRLPSRPRPKALRTRRAAAGRHGLAAPEILNSRPGAGPVPRRPHLEGRRPAPEATGPATGRPGPEPGAAGAVQPHPLRLLRPPCHFPGEELPGHSAPFPARDPVLFLSRPARRSPGLRASLLAALPGLAQGRPCRYPRFRACSRRCFFPTSCSTPLPPCAAVIRRRRGPFFSSCGSCASS